MQWEYKTIKLATTGLLGGNMDEMQLEEQLNELGNDGWEAVTAIDLNADRGATRNVMIILKRQH